MDELIVIKAKLHNYRFPKNKVHNSGEYAIVLLEVLEVLEGDIPAKAYSRYGDRTIIVTGNMPRLNYDIEYKVQAKKVTDPKWGIQYECENIRMNYNLDNPDDQRKFLGFFLTDLQIDALFNQFENPIVPLRDNDIDALTTIKGIGPVTANRMCIKYAENIDNGRAYVELKELGITKYAIDRLIKQFGSADAVVELINENPYRLIKLVRGYGWEKADQIALKQGFTTDCKERCIAYAQYRLEKNADDGNSLMSIGELLEEIYQVCMPVTPENLMNYLKEDMANEEMFEELYQKVVDGEKDIKFPTFFFSNSVKKVGLFYYRLLERKIAAELKRLQEAPSFIKYDKETCASIIKEVEAEQGYEYTSEQKDAIYNILFNNVSVLTGSSGVGKSSTVKPLIKIFERYGETVSQCALSGRAASLLTEYTKLEGKTIHRLLGYVADLEGFVHDENNPLSSDVIILDETSMVGEELFLDLIKSIKSGAKLIMLGDIKQLPPMYVGNILSDCMSSGYISVNVLTIIHRQALKSGIISESLKVCEGKYLTKNTMVGEEIRGELQDFKLVCYPDAGLVHTKALEQFKYLLSKGINSDDIQIVVPVRSKGMNSCRFFNAEIQQLVNPGNGEGVECDIYDNGQKFTVVYRPGDKIMVMQNNYHARTIRGRETAIFNGNLGHIIEINDDSMILEVEGQNDKIILPKEQWSTIIHGWASTCHKCVTGDTLIYTDQGLKRIDELYNGAQIGEQKILDSNILVFNGEYYEKPSHFYNAGLSETLKISTKYNYQLECTLDHKLKVQRDGQELMIPASELVEGDLVAVAINFQNPVQDKLPIAWGNRCLDKRSKLYVRPTHMSEDFALFLGMMVADGTLRRQGFHYYKNNIETVKVFQSLVKNLFGYDADIRKHGKNTEAWGVECSSTDIAQFLLNIDGIQPYNKHVPSCIFTSSKSCQQKFLQGVFEDGAVHMKKGKFDMIELCCKQGRCAQEIRMLLLQQGILSSVYHYYNNKYSKKTGKLLDCYKIMIYSGSAKKFQETINFLDEDKQKKLQLVLSHPECSNSKENFASEKTGVIFLPIMSIEKSVNQTYCLTMPSSHLFVQNGIVGSNCQGSGFPYVIVCLDNSAYVLLMREWLYTALTRAKKYCILVGQPSAINTACRTSNIKIKQTWLRDELQKLYLDSVV